MDGEILHLQGLEIKISVAALEVEVLHILRMLSGLLLGDDVPVLEVLSNQRLIVLLDLHLLFPVDYWRRVRAGFRECPSGQASKQASARGTMLVCALGCSEKDIP